MQDITDDLARSMNLRVSRGALVNRVDRGAPAARAGIQVGDVITAIDGQRVETSHELVRAVTRHGVGERVTLSLLRNGQPRTVQTVTANFPSAAETPLPPVARGGGPAPRRVGLGMRVAALPPQLAARVGVPPNAAVVVDIEPGGAADEAGLRYGDVILRADGHDVHTTRDILDAAHDGRVALLVRRGEAQRFIPLQLE